MSREGFASSLTAAEAARLRRPGCRCSVQQLELVGCECDPPEAPRAPTTPPAALRAWAAGMSDQELADAVVAWERFQTEAGAGIARANCNRRLGYLRREAKRRARS